MAKITLQTIVSGIRSLANINANFAAIAETFERVLFRDGTAPNAMSSDLDLNTNRVINLAPGVASGDAVNKAQIDNLGNTLSQDVIEQIASRVAPLIDPGAPVQPITIQGPLLLNTTSGSPVQSTTYTATGGSGTITWSATDAPAGITINSSTGVISGTMTSQTPGSYPFRVTATDEVLQTRTITVTLVQEAPEIFITPSGTATSAVVGQAYTSQLYTISGGVGSYTISQTGGLISGITRQETATTFQFTGTIANTVSTGQYNITVTVTDGYSSTAVTVSINVQASTPVIDPLAIDYTRGGLYSLEPGPAGETFPISVRAGTTYDYYWTVTGGEQPYSYAVLNSNLPTGVTFNLQTGRFQGTIAPQVSESGPDTYFITFRITDSGGRTLTGGWNFEVYPQRLNFIPFSFPQPIEDEAYDSAPVAAIVLTGGTKPYTLTAAVQSGFDFTTLGTLDYVALNGDPAANTGWKIAGTPTATPSTDGTYNWVTRVTSADGQVIDIPVTITIRPAAETPFTAPEWLIQPSNLTVQEFYDFFGVPGYGVVINHDATYVDKNDADDYRTIFVPGPGGLAPGWTHVEANPGSPTNKVHQFTYDGITGVSQDTTTTGHRFDIEYSEPTNPVATGNETSWTRRSTASGVIRALRFDSIDDIAPGVTPRTSNEGFYYAGQTSVDPTLWAWDTSVKASGSGSLRLLVKKNTSQQSGQFGYYLDPIVRYSNSGGSGHDFGPNADATRKEVWMQFLWRPSSARIQHMFNNEGPGSKGAEKIVQVQTDLHDSLGEDNFPIVNWAGNGTPGVYWNSSQVWGSFNAPHAISRTYTGGRGSDRFYQTGVSTGAYANPSGDNQARDNWGPGQYTSTWGSFVGPDDYRDLGTRPYVGGGYQFAVDVFNVCTIRWKAGTTSTSQDGILQCWWSAYGSAPKLVFSTNQLRTAFGINSIHFTQYMTGKTAEGTAAAEDCFVWFDELITSRTKIDHPNPSGSDFVIPDSDLIIFPSQW